MSEIKAGDICIVRRLRIAVRVTLVDSLVEEHPTALCETLTDSRNYRKGAVFMPPLTELVTIEQLCEECSDFMTFTASVMNIAPQDEPVNKGLVWRFWNLGRQARLHLMKWNVREQLE